MSVVVVLLALAAAPGADDAWCARARGGIVGAPATGEAALTRFEAVVGELFPTGSPVVARARAVIGDEGDFGAAFAVLATAADEACAPLDAADATAAAARVKDLVASDPRFAGVRRGDDWLDRLRHRFFLWLGRLFESEGMQRFAGSTRVIFFVGLGAVALALAVRVVRRLRRREPDTLAAQAHLEAARAEAFAVLRAQAGACLSRADARGALLAGERALRARIGEREGHAVRAARTHREILAELTPPLAQAVAPALRAFDLALFSRDATVDDAAGFLKLVDDAEAGVRAARAAATGAP